MAFVVTISEKVTVSWWGVSSEVIMEVLLGVHYAVLLWPEDVFTCLCTFGVNLAILDLEDPFDSAVAACFSTTFYSVSRTGEFTVPSLSAFDLSLHVKPSDVSNQTDRNNLEVTVFHLPKTIKSMVIGFLLGRLEVGGARVTAPVKAAFTSASFGPCCSM